MVQITIVITAFREPHTIGKTIESIINQNIPYSYELLAFAPDLETAKVIKNYAKKYKKIKYIKDPGKGKYTALNLAFRKAKGEILIFTDGDVFLAKDSIKEILKPFKNKKIGCITGRPVSINSRDYMFGFWSNILTYAAHKMRIEKVSQNKPIIVSGYLFAMRNKVIKKIPLDVAEDAIIPYMFYDKGYKIGYAPNAVVNVKYPTSFRDWISQKKRSIKSNRDIGKYVKAEKMRTFFSEAGGIKMIS